MNPSAPTVRAEQESIAAHHTLLLLTHENMMMTKMKTKMMTEMELTTYTYGHDDNSDDKGGHEDKYEYGYEEEDGDERECEYQ